MRTLLIVLLPFISLSLSSAQAPVLIPIETEHTALVLRVEADQTVLVAHLGQRLQNPAEYSRIPVNGRNPDGYTDVFQAAYSTSGTRNLLEPAIQAVHADGNPSLELKYVSHETRPVGQDVTLTTVVLKDPNYPFTVTLHYRAYRREDVLEQWSVIRHAEKAPVRLQKYLSANLYLPAEKYFLTHFHGEWAQEMRPEEVELTAGLKILDSKLGTRADLFQPPSFLLSLNQPAQEETGAVIGGNLSWSGNYQLAFEVDPLHHLRVLAGINPYASEYTLAPNRDFTTPAFVFSYSTQGKGGVSRNLHRWARNHRIAQGNGNRLTLLNNWEATYFDFDETKLATLIGDAKKLGVDMFLLDDGWFGNKHPRNGDTAGLGDWQENVKKLPSGLGYLVKAADKTGVKFGLWIEPEMVNPKSELYEKHPDWVLRQPNRPETYFRHQLVFDLSNPQVQDFVYGIVDGLMTRNPGIAYFKWDCNSVIFNAYSATLPNKQNLYVDYVQGLYKVLDRLRAKYPKLPMMLCSGGGGRVDYGALQYFTEFWPSDNTDPLERIFIQWNSSYFFPAIATCNHVTDWGKQPLKFRTDVAMMGKLGYDIIVSKLTPDELTFSQQALATYNRLKPVIWQGDLFRLKSPYAGNLASMLYVSEQQDKAVWFSYLTGNRYRAGSSEPVRLQGLNPAKTYRIQEQNVMPGGKPMAEATYTGDYLMTVGVNPQISDRRTSVVLELTQLP